MATAAGEMHLLDVSVLPCAYVKEVIEGSWKHLQEGTEKGSGRTLYGFKVGYMYTAVQYITAFIEI